MSDGEVDVEAGGGIETGEWPPGPGERRRVRWCMFRGMFMFKFMGMGMVGVEASSSTSSVPVPSLEDTPERLDFVEPN